MSKPPEPAPPADQHLTDAKSSEQLPSLDQRLLLYEILLEEYESIKPPPTAAMQPQIDEAVLQVLKESGKKRKDACCKIVDVNVREERETKLNGELAATIFTLLARAQQAAGVAKVAELRNSYETELKKLSPNLDDKSKESLSDPTAQDKLIKRAILQDIHGVVADRQEQHWQDIIKTTDLTNPDTRAKLEDQAQQQACKSTFEKESQAIAKPAADGTKGGAGNGSTSAGAPEPRKTAKNDEEDEARWAYARAQRSALCLSGGGIRSATFNLGILQGLARHGLLKEFDYLSTVSGGGFVGGWLTAWLHRRGLTGVIDELSKPPASPLRPDPQPIDHLRVYSNYLSPQPGLLSADTWTLIATLLRNLLLTWLVFLPLLIVMLLLPRAWLTIVFRQTFSHDWAVWLSFWLGSVAGWFALTCTGLSLPSTRGNIPPHPHNRYQTKEKVFLYCCLLPSVGAAAAFATYWARLNDCWTNSAASCAAAVIPWQKFICFTLRLVALPWLVCFVVRLVKAIIDYRRAPTPAKSKRLRWIAPRLLLATVLIVLAQCITGGLLYVAAEWLLPLLGSDPRWYATFSVPALLLILLLDCTLLVGFTSSLTEDDDREWWARAGAWVLIVIVAWSAIHLLVLFGPALILRLNASVQQARSSGFLSFDSLKAAGQILGVLAGIVSGIITLAGGFSGKTSANEKEARQTGQTGLLITGLTSLVAPVFLAFLLILLALGTDWLLTCDFGRWLNNLWPWLVNITCGFGLWLDKLWPWLVDAPTADQLWQPNFVHKTLVEHTPLRYLAVWALLIWVVGTIMGLLLNTNTFSLHYMWRNRIIRAYLGASRKKRSPNSFTGFDTNDDIYMHELRPQPTGTQCPTVNRPAEDEPKPNEPRKLFHILNIALNLSGGDKLAWQDRKAESFTVSPLHVGSYWLGYRRSCVYGGPNGISLGTAVAISGAFVSPNMGYMMSSPVVRFLMTLFNVRFGWWLGNPGVAGDETYRLERLAGPIGWLFGRRSGKPFELASPLLSVRPVVSEAFGQTNDKAPYVYLSDGGHFENLGLYEMVLRRVRTIVVCDASTDAGYSFDSLAQAIRQIRVDLGIPIDLREMSISSPSQNLKGKYCARGKIRYSCVDRQPDNRAHAGLKDEDFDGDLIYIKASMIGDEPRDVINYGQASKNFPQEIIVDQWFSEAQFESYRALGSHIIDAICGGDQNKLTLPAFSRKVREHNKMNLRVFQDQINYAALETQIKESMRQHTPQMYQQQVAQYLKDLLD